MPEPSASRGRVWIATFPGWTHVIATVAFPAWAIGTDAHLYGIDTRYEWWQSVGAFMTALTTAVLLLVLPPAVAVEAWAVDQRRRWVARVAVICYIVVAGFVAFIPTSLRFAGDTTPTPIDDITLSLTLYGITTGAQALCVYAACRFLASPTRAAGRPSRAPTAAADKR